MNDHPWEFGWTQLLTIIGFLITVLIAIGGFRSFERWRRERIEEKKIDTAIEALVLVREAKFIFENIRSPMSFDYEWKDMPQSPGDDESMRRTKGSYFAILKRIDRHREFFQRAWKLQTMCGVLFGEKANEAFLLLQKARREVEVSAGMLVNNPIPEIRNPENKRTWDKFRADVWGGTAEAMKVRDTVAEKLEQFESGVRSVCEPIVEHKLRKRNVMRDVLDWLGI